MYSERVQTKMYRMSINIIKRKNWMNFVML